MTTCPKCQYERQQTDTAPDYECPKCGVIYAKYSPPRRKKAASQERVSVAQTVAKGGLILIGVSILGYAGWVMRGPSTVAKVAKEIVYNSGIDGSVRQAEQHIKGQLKDPASYEAIEWSKVVKIPAGYAVRVKYRAKNSFGGYVIEQKMVTLDVAGNVTGIANY